MKKLLLTALLLVGCAAPERGPAPGEPLVMYLPPVSLSYYSITVDKQLLRDATDPNVLLEIEETEEKALNVLSAGMLWNIKEELIKYRARWVPLGSVVCGAYGLSCVLVGMLPEHEVALREVLKQKQFAPMTMDLVDPASRKDMHWYIETLIKNSGQPPTDVRSTEPDLAEYLGLLVKDVMDIAMTRGLTTRIAGIDGDQCPLTCDYIETRLNLIVQDGVVVRLHRG